MWKPALVEIEEALVPAFIIEELEDQRVTVFVPSVPTPFAGASTLYRNALSPAQHKHQRGHDRACRCTREGGMALLYFGNRN